MLVWRSRDPGFYSRLSFKISIETEIYYKTIYTYKNKTISNFYTFRTIRNSAERMDLKINEDKTN